MYIGEAIIIGIICTDTHTHTHTHTHRRGYHEGGDDDLRRKRASIPVKRDLVHQEKRPIAEVALPIPPHPSPPPPPPSPPPDDNGQWCDFLEDGRQSVRYLYVSSS
jgi:hypothetical protein